MAEKPQLNIVEFPTLTIFAPAPGVEGKLSRLVFGLVNDNPRLTVFTNVPDGSGQTDGKGRPRGAMIMVPMNRDDLHILLQAVQDTATKPDHGSYVFEYSTTKATEGGQREKFLAAKIAVGRDEDGVIYLAVKSEGKPSVKFSFELSPYAKINYNGKPVEKNLGSSLAAVAKVKRVHDAYRNYLDKASLDRAGNAPAAGHDAPVRKDFSSEDIEF